MGFVWPAVPHFRLYFYDPAQSEPTRWKTHSISPGGGSALSEEPVAVEISPMQAWALLGASLHTSQSGQGWGEGWRCSGVPTVGAAAPSHCEIGRIGGDDFYLVGTAVCGFHIQVPGFPGGALVGLQPWLPQNLKLKGKTLQGLTEIFEVGILPRVKVRLPRVLALACNHRRRGPLQFSKEVTLTSLREREEGHHFSCRPHRPGFASWHGHLPAGLC